MAHERDGALVDTRPEWADLVDGFLRATEIGMVEREEVGKTMQGLYLHLFVDGQLNDFGALQRFLRTTSASVQLVAKRFDEFANPALACVDPVTGEPRDYTVHICHGGAEVARELSRLVIPMAHEVTTPISHEVHEAILQKRAGIILPSFCVKSF